ncbi:MAG: sce7725 family protein, partial [Bdellovibrionales bacterium]|nr:sce7725 family protein [Bdellovibrionales bacterium]
VCKAEGTAIVVVNPYHGDHSDDGADISALLGDKYLKSANIAAGILLHEDVTLDDAIALVGQHKKHRVVLIHRGFTNAKELAGHLGADLKDFKQIFFEPYSGRLYRKHFEGCERVLLRDGFQRRINREYPEIEFFSDLHVTYEDEDMDGFGDFLTVGDDYSESGGPAYAVAIHLTFIDPDKDDAMFAYHFVSDRKDTPTDPAGKFAEAVGAMVARLDKPDSKVEETKAVVEFRELHANKHFPGLGYIKKLSMQHHIETLAHYFA